MKRFPSADPAVPSPRAGSARGAIDPSVGVRVDCHQHLWSEGLVEALRRRSRNPRMSGWTLHLDGEPAYDVDPAAHDPLARAGQDRADGVGRTLYSLSAPLGIESLDPAEATPLLAAWHALADGAGDAEGPGLGIWAAPRLVEPDLDDLARTLALERVVGLQVPATHLVTPAALEALAPLLAVAERADLPVLVHPGPAAPPGGSAPDLPAWWPALVDYPAQLAAAWHAWHVAGRSLLPSLRVAFVALAGLAPLHHERLAQRGGRLGAIDPDVHYETSSYGTRAIDAMVRVVGVDALVHGSDRPYADPTDPGLGEAFDHALHVTNPHHLLNGGDR